MFYWKKSLLEKAVIIKIFEYSPLYSELKKQIDIAKKQCQRRDKVYEFDKKEEDKTKNINKKRRFVKSNLYYSCKFNFYKYQDTKKFIKDSFTKK